MTCFFFNDTATTEIYTLSLHDALPIYEGKVEEVRGDTCLVCPWHGSAFDLESGQPRRGPAANPQEKLRSEEHTSELQSRQYLVCRLLLEKKKPAAIRNLPPLEHTRPVA